MSHILQRTDSVFRQIFDETFETQINFSSFDTSPYSAQFLELARQNWGTRLQTEFRSLQIMNQFLADVVNAGDPLDVYAGAVDLVKDEIFHIALCRELLKTLGGQPMLPTPVELKQSEGFLTMKPAERALATAIGMLAINETLSVGFIEDLHARCEQPLIHKILSATLDDEETHQDFGWEYIRVSLKRFGPSTLPAWRKVANQALAPHLSTIEQVLNTIPKDKRTLAAWPDEQLIELGLFSNERHALILQRNMRETLLPQLRKLQLVD